MNWRLANADALAVLEDLQALLTGTLFISLGIAMFKHAGRLTGGTVGPALLPELTELQPLALHFDWLLPRYAATRGDLLMGSGFLMLFRHRASPGGVGIVALALQQDCGWRVGKVQMAVGGAILLAALFVVDPQHIGYTLVGALALNLTLAVKPHAVALHGDVSPALRFAHVSPRASAEPAEQQRCQQ